MMYEKRKKLDVGESDAKERMNEILIFLNTYITFKNIFPDMLHNHLAVYGG